MIYILTVMDDSSNYTGTIVLHGPWDPIKTGEQFKDSLYDMHQEILKQEEANEDTSS